MGEMLNLIIDLLKVAGLVLGEIFAAKKRKRIEDEEYKKNLDTQLKKIRQKVISIVDRQRNENKDAKEREDRREEDRRKEKIK